MNTAVRVGVMGVEKGRSMIAKGNSAEGIESAGCYLTVTVDGEFWFLSLVRRCYGRGRFDYFSRSFDSPKKLSLPITSSTSL